MSWRIAERLGQWPKDVYEHMDYEWFRFGLDLSAHDAEVQDKAARQSGSARRPRTMGGR